MTDRELDERIAKSLGWGINSYDPDYFNVDHCGTVISRRDFSPATSVDAMRKWVLPYLEGKMLMYEFSEKLWHHWNTTDDVPNEFGVFMLTAEPSALAAAALAVLEEDNAR